MMSDDVKRYAPILCGTQDEDWIEMEEGPTGEWVKWEDYKILLASERRMGNSNYELCEKIDRLRSQVITDEQIDKAWGLAHSDPDAEDCLAFLGIVECPECGGVGRIKNKRGRGGTFIIDAECARCHGHGWIREERGDE